MGVYSIRDGNCREFNVIMKANSTICIVQVYNCCIWSCHRLFNFSKYYCIGPSNCNAASDISINQVGFIIKLNEIFIIVIIFSLNNSA